jgi:hypothetical protein
MNEPKVLSQYLDEQHEDEAVPGFTFLHVLGILALLFLIGAIAIPNLIQARKHGNEASAIGALKTLATSESIFREGDREEDGNLDYGMLSELARTQLVDGVLGSGTKQGYLFAASYGFATSEFLWFAIANPEIPTITGDRYFTTNQAGVIYYTSGARADLDVNTCTLPRGGGPLPGGKGRR